MDQANKGSMNDQPLRITFDNHKSHHKHKDKHKHKHHHQHHHEHHEHHEHHHVHQHTKHRHKHERDEEQAHKHRSSVVTTRTGQNSKRIKIESEQQQSCTDPLSRVPLRDDADVARLLSVHLVGKTDTAAVKKHLRYHYEADDDRWMKQVVSLILAGSFIEAIQYLQQRFSSNLQNNMSALSSLGVCYHYMCNYHAAAILYYQAARLVPASEIHPALCFNIAVCCKERGRYHDSIDYSIRSINRYFLQAEEKHNPSTDDYRACFKCLIEARAAVRRQEVVFTINDLVVSLHYDGVLRVGQVVSVSAPVDPALDDSNLYDVHFLNPRSHINSVNVLPPMKVLGNNWTILANQQVKQKYQQWFNIQQQEQEQDQKQQRQQQTHS